MLNGNNNVESRLLLRSLEKNFKVRKKEEYLLLKIRKVPIQTLFEWVFTKEKRKKTRFLT